jgi:hypothetical protein
MKLRQNASAAVLTGTLYRARTNLFSLYIEAVCATPAHSEKLQLPSIVLNTGHQVPQLPVLDAVWPVCKQCHKSHISALACCGALARRCLSHSATLMLVTVTDKVKSMLDNPTIGAGVVAEVGVARKAARLLCAVVVRLSAEVHGGAAPMEQPDLPAVDRDHLLLQGGQPWPPGVHASCYGAPSTTTAASWTVELLLDAPCSVSPYSLSSHAAFVRHPVRPAGAAGLYSQEHVLPKGGRLCRHTKQPQCAHTSSSLRF